MNGTQYTPNKRNERDTVTPDKLNFNANTAHLHDVVDVLHSTKPFRPQLQPRGHLELGEASLQVQLDAVAGPALPAAELVRRLYGIVIP